MRRKNPSFSYEECQGVVLREEEKEMKKRIVFHPGDHAVSYTHLALVIKTSGRDPQSLNIGGCKVAA